MLKILVPVDGSRNAVHAVRHVIAEYRKHPSFEVHLLNVQMPFSRHVAQFVHVVSSGPAGEEPPRAHAPRIVYAPQPNLPGSFYNKKADRSGG